MASARSAIQMPDEEIEGEIMDPAGEQHRVAREQPPHMASMLIEAAAFDLEEIAEDQRRHRRCASKVEQPITQASATAKASAAARMSARPTPAGRALLPHRTMLPNPSACLPSISSQ